MKYWLVYTQSDVATDPDLLVGDLGLSVIVSTCFWALVKGSHVDALRLAGRLDDETGTRWCVISPRPGKWVSDSDGGSVAYVDYYHSLVADAETVVKSFPPGHEIRWYITSGPVPEAEELLHDLKLVYDETVFWPRWAYYAC